MTPTQLGQFQNQLLSVAAQIRSQQSRVVPYRWLITSVGIVWAIILWKMVVLAGGFSVSAAVMLIVGTAIMLALIPVTYLIVLSLAWAGQTEFWVRYRARKQLRKLFRAHMESQLPDQARRLQHIMNTAWWWVAALLILSFFGVSGLMVPAMIAAIVYFGGDIVLFVIWGKGTWARNP